MRKSVIMFVTVLTVLTVQTVSAFFQNPCCCCFSGIRERSLEFHIGYRRDTFHWKFQDPTLNLFQTMLPLFVAVESQKLCDSGTGTGTQVIPEAARFCNDSNSEVCALGIEAGLVANELCNNNTFREKWKDLRMLNIGGEGKFLTCDDFYLRLNGNYGYVCDGKYKPEGAYAGAFFPCEEIYSRCGCAPAPSKRAHGHSWDISGAVGYQMTFCDCDFKFTPVLGFAYHDIDLHTDQCKVCRFFNEVAGEVCELVGEGFSKWASNTKFNSHFTGPYLGFDWTYNLGCSSRLYGNFEYHWARYCGDSKIKSKVFIESDFEEDCPDFASTNRDLYFDEFTELLCCHSASFKQRACARGLIWSIGADYNFCECWYAGFAFHWTDWRTFKNGCLRAKSFTDCDVEEVVNGLGQSSTVRQFFEEDAEFASLFCKDTRFTNAHWNSYRLELTLSRYF